MWYLKIETDEEWRVVASALAETGADPGAPVDVKRTARAVHARLVATPESRHGGLVFVEDATYAESGPARCEGHVRDQSGTTHNGQRACGLTLSSDGTCPGAVLHVQLGAEDKGRVAVTTNGGVVRPTLAEQVTASGQRCQS